CPQCSSALTHEPLWLSSLASCAPQSATPANAPIRVRLAVGLARFVDCERLKWPIADVQCALERTFTYSPGASARGASLPAPGSRAGTSGPERFFSHASQCGHHEPGCSCAKAIQSSTPPLRLA